MPRIPLRVRLLASAAAVAAVLAAQQGAHAAAFQLKENSALGLGTAFAGEGSAANTPATVFANPAGMTQLPGLQIATGLSGIIPTADFRGTARDAFGRPISGATDRNGGDGAAILHGHVTYKVTPDLSVGLALTTPYGLATYYKPGFVGRYHADKTDLKTINVNPAVAYQVAPWLSVGAGFSAQWARAEFASSINSSSVAARATGRPVALRDGYFRLRGDDISFGWNVGVLLQPGPATRVGLTYRSRIQQDFEGTVTYDTPLPLSLSPAFRSGDGRAKLVLPDTAGASITQGLGPNWTVYADVTWTNWSQFKSLDAYRPTGELLTSTPQRYDNSYFVSLGAAYKFNEALTLRAGTAYDKSPVSDAYRTARVPDGSRRWLAIGASYTVLPGVTVDAGYAHVFVNNSSIDEVNATGDVLTGRYRNSIDILSLGMRTVF